MFNLNTMFIHQHHVYRSRYLFSFQPRYHVSITGYLYCPILSISCCGVGPNPTLSHSPTQSKRAFIPCNYPRPRHRQTHDRGSGADELVIFYSSLAINLSLRLVGCGDFYCDYILFLVGDRFACSIAWLNELAAIDP